MNNYKKIFVILFCLSFCSMLKAQERKDDIINQLIEMLSENEEEQQDYNSLAEDLLRLYDTPINLNEATKEQLEALPFLSTLTISNLLNYRNQVGQIHTIYELAAVQGITPEILKHLSCFITLNKKINPPIRIKDVLQNSRHSLLLRGRRSIEKQKGYKLLKHSDFKTDEAYEKWQKRRYLGSPWQYYLRYEAHYKRTFSMGWVAEKDAGEEFWEGTQKQGFDHYTGFVQLNDIGILKTVILGDYTPQFGQGLVAWRAYTMGKSSYFIDVNKRNSGLKRYASTDENRYMRGVGVTIVPLKRLQLTTYYSNKKIDGGATENSFSGPKKEEVSSFVNSGYHRSHKEIAQRKTVGEEVLGLDINLKHSNLKVGGSFINYNYSRPLKKRKSLKDYYSFSGKFNQNYSLYANYRYAKFYIFGEFALDRKQSKALLGGVIFNADERLNFTMLYRNYEKDYHALYASGFGDKSNTQNEQGCYIGMEMLPWAKWKLSAYFDTYKRPWLQTGVHAPARGYDYKVRLSYRHSDKLNAYFQFYQEKNQKNSESTVDKVKFLVDESRKRLRIHLEYKVLPHILFRNRISLSFYRKEDKKNKGFLLLHDFVYQPEHFPLSFSTRYALFDVDDYQARIYTYENDILYAFSMPAFQNRGFRFYWNAKWNINEHLSLWAKYAITQYSDRETIGSGLNLIEGNRMQELKLQLRYKF